MDSNKTKDKVRNWFDHDPKDNSLRDGFMYSLKNGPVERLKNGFQLGTQEIIKKSIDMLHLL